MPANARAVLPVPSQPTTHCARTIRLPLSTAVTPSPSGVTAVSIRFHSGTPPSSAIRSRSALSTLACDTSIGGAAVRSPGSPNCRFMIGLSPRYVVIRIARNDSSGSVPNAPSRSSTSEPRACRKFARDVTAGPDARSITRTETPCNNKPHASVRPVGPAPTTKTSTKSTRAMLCSEKPCLNATYSLKAGATSSRAPSAASLSRITCSWLGSDGIAARQSPSYTRRQRAGMATRCRGRWRPRTPWRPNTAAIPRRPGSSLSE